MLHAQCCWQGFPDERCSKVGAIQTPPLLLLLLAGLDGRVGLQAATCSRVCT